MWFGTVQLYGLMIAIAFQVGTTLFLKAAGVSIAAPVTGKKGGQPGQAPSAKQRGPKAWLKWSALVFQLIAGGGYSVALLVGVMGILVWLGYVTAGWLSMGLTIAILAVGWWALDGIVAMVKDLADGVPDQEAFRSALFLPTTIPLGFGALWAVFTNPAGFPTGAGALIISAIGGIFMHRIIGKIADVSTGTKIWRWATVALCLIVGLMHVPAFIYVNDWVGILPAIDIAGKVHVELSEALRCAAVAGAIAMFFYAAGDNLRGDKLPGWPTWWASMYSIPTTVVLGAIAMTGFNSSANAIFTAFS